MKLPIFQLAIGVMLFLALPQANGQNCSPNSVDIVNVSCAGSNDGSISVTPKPCGNQEVCYSGTPVPEIDCNNCSQSFSGNNLNITVSSGQKICITGNSSISNLTLNGGTLVICGTVTLSNWINMTNPATLVVLGSATINNGGINITNVNSQVYNYGTLKLNGGGMSISGSVVNYGTLEANGDVNINDGTARLDNYVQLTVKNSLNSAETLNNWGTINVGTAGMGSKLQFNSSSKALNACTITVTGDALFDAASVFDHRGKLTISKDVYINGNSVIQLMGGTKIQTKGNLIANSGVVGRVGGIGCSLFETQGYSTFNSGSHIRGNIAYCARGGISSNPPIENGAVISCTSCIPPANPPQETVSITWTGPGGTSYTGAQISNLAPGNYQMNLVCSDCSYSHTYTITEPPALSVSVTLSQDQKSATASASGGVEPYTYQWTGPVSGTGASLNNLLPGTYTITAYDAKNCPATTTLEISAANCHPVVNQIPISCFGANDGKIAIVDPGCSNAEILWLELGSSSPTVSNLGPGTYRVHITCQDVCSEVVSFTLNEPQLLSLQVNTNENDISTLSSQGGTGPYSYGWYLDNVLLSSSMTSEGLPSGTYEARVIDDRGCLDSEIITITTNDQGCNPDVKVSHITCDVFNGKIEVNPSSICESAVILWTNNTGHVVGTGPTLITSAGEYTLTLLCEDCSFSKKYTVNAVPPLTVSAEAIGITAKAHVTGGTMPYMYQWIFDGRIVSTDPEPEVLPGDINKLVVTDAYGCPAETTVFVNTPECNPTSKVTPVSCPGAEDGSIEITSPGCESEIENCGYVPDTPTPDQLCDCSSIITGSVNTVTVGNEKVCIGGAYIINLVIEGNGMAVICGDANISHVTINSTSSGVLVVNGTANISAFDFNSPTAKLYNYGSMYIIDRIDHIPGEVYNNGTMGIYCNLELDASSKMINKGPFLNILRNSTLNAYGRIENYSVFKVQGQSAGVNMWVSGTSAYFVNYCSVKTQEAIKVQNSGTAENYGTIEGLTEPAPFYVLYPSARLFLYDKSVIHASTFAVDRCTVKHQGEGCSRITVEGQTSFRLAKFNGNISYCDLTPNQGDSGNASFINGAGKNCNCEPETPNNNVQYTWFGIDAQGTTATNLAKGYYQVGIYCEGNCYSLKGFTIGSPPPLEVSATVSQNGLVSSTISGGTPFSTGEPYLYTWTSDNGVSIPSVANPTLPIPGNYTLTVTDSKNCSMSTGVTWQTPSCQNTPTVTIKPSSCGSLGDGKITVINTQCSSGDQVAYLWNGPGITEANNRLASQDKLIAGTYTLTMTCGASCTSTYQYEVPSVNAINIKSIAITKQVSCNQAFDGELSVQVDGGSGAYNYQWSDSWKIIGTNSPTLSGLTAGVYFVTVTDKNGENGCIGEGTITLDEPGENCTACINAEITKNDLRCAGVPEGSLQVRMKDNGTYIYKWNTGQTSSRLIGLDAGIYSVEITNTFNGDKCTRRIFINEPEDFEVDILMTGGPEVCPGETVRLEAVSASPVTFSWTPVNPAGISNPVLVTQQVGTYSVTAKQGGCTKTASVTLANAPASSCNGCQGSLTANVTITPLTCYLSGDGRAEVLVSGGSGNYSYVWNTGSTERILTNVPAGTYTVSISDLNSDLSCKVTKSVTITQPNTLKVLIGGYPVVCDGYGTSLTATGAFGTGTTYIWTKVGTNEVFPNTQSIGVNEEGTYFVEVRNGLCAARSSDFKVTQQYKPTITRSKSKMCPGDTVVLRASSATDILWSTGQTTQEIKVVNPGTYTVSAKPGLCSAVSESVTVTLKSPEECEKPNLCEPDFAIPLVLENPCVQETINRAEQRARERWEEYVDIQRKDFQRQYIAKCLQTQEELTMKYNEQEHHYTLFYYDQSGNLVRTVPPKGVKLIEDQATLDKIKQERLAGTARTVETAHSYMTTYQFNSNNQSVGLIMPDHKPMGNNPKISQRQWYDELGRLVLSQTSYHFAQNPKRYQYVQYDRLGREIENGEVRSNVDIATIQKPGFDTRIESDKLQYWLSTQRKYEVHRNYYDSVTFVIPEFSQQNLRNRLASATYEVDDVDGDPFTYDNGLHYSYDVHGNVKEQITDYPELEHLASRYKSLAYIYDLVSQNVLEMHYQKGHLDQYFYRNEYDADNRLIQTWTSRDYIHWDRDTKQFFYDHGPLARTEIGHEKVQGVDYAYTIQGWIKGMNSNTLTADRDMGHDGMTGTLHRNIPKDEMGYSLGFYKGDYSAIGNSNFLINTTGSELETANKDLYNGNISNLITSINQFMKNGQGPLAQTFKYDQLNRLKESKAYEDPNSMNSNSWSASGTATNKYMTKYTYDANGNILTLKRNAHVGTTPEGDGLDDLIYQYENNTNKLINVEEQRDNSNNPELEELDDIKPRN